jgi:hypothetical protein
LLPSSSLPGVNFRFLWAGSVMKSQKICRQKTTSRSSRLCRTTGVYLPIPILHIRVHVFLIRHASRDEECSILVYFRLTTFDLREFLLTIYKMALRAALALAESFTKFNGKM